MISDKDNLTPYCIVLVGFLIILRLFAFAALNFQIYFHSQSAGLRIQYLIYKNEFHDESSTMSQTSSCDKNNKIVRNDLTEM